MNCLTCSGSFKSACWLKYRKDLRVDSIVYLLLPSFSILSKTFRCVVSGIGAGGVRGLWIRCGVLGKDGVFG